MRTALTIGILKNGKAEVINHPDMPLHEQRRAFHGLDDKGSKYAEIQLWESGKGLNKRYRLTSGKKGGVEGGVNFNSAHPVEDQQDKSKAKTLPDLTPSEGGKGEVNHDAWKPVEGSEDELKPNTPAKRKSKSKQARVARERKAKPATKPSKKKSLGKTAGAARTDSDPSL